MKKNINELKEVISDFANELQSQITKKELALEVALQQLETLEELVGAKIVKLNDDNTEPGKYRVPEILKMECRIPKPRIKAYERYMDKLKNLSYEDRLAAILLYSGHDTCELKVQADAVK